MHARFDHAMVMPEMLIVLTDLTQESPQLFALLQSSGALPHQTRVLVRQQPQIVGHDLHAFAAELLLTSEVCIGLNADVYLSLEVPLQLVQILLTLHADLSEFSFVGVPRALHVVDLSHCVLNLIAKLESLGSDLFHLLQIQLTDDFLNISDVFLQSVFVADERVNDGFDLVVYPLLEFRDQGFGFASGIIEHLVIPVLSVCQMCLKPVKPLILQFVVILPGTDADVVVVLPDLDDAITGAGHVHGSLQVLGHLDLAIAVVQVV
mmetsp:Transcript_5803/g.14281  ORF Transcript_5803/g.14281 Transcript_5803/m.14281 type:complete len:264 (+) Transcript_5803:879-1670(+)